MGLRDKFVKGAVALGALISAGEIGQHIGHDDAVKEQSDLTTKNTMDKDAQKNDAEKKEAEDKVKVLANQDKILTELRGYSAAGLEEATKELKNKLEKAKLLSELKNSKNWLRANNNQELWNSGLILKKLISDSGEGGLTFEEAKVVVSQHADLKDSLAYCFTKLLELKDKLKDKTLNKEEYEMLIADKNPDLDQARHAVKEAWNRIDTINYLLNDKRIEIGNLKYGGNSLKAFDDPDYKEASSKAWDQKAIENEKLFNNVNLFITDLDTSIETIAKMLK